MRQFILGIGFWRVVAVTGLLGMPGGTALAQSNLPPVVSNVTASQIPGTQQVEIRYLLADPEGASCTVWLEVSDNEGVRWSIPATHVSGDVGVGVQPASGKRILWNAGSDWPNHVGSLRFRVSANDGNAPLAMALIPAGEFQMGDSFNEGDNNQRPVHGAYIDSFYLDRYEVTNEQYANALKWAKSKDLIAVPNGVVYKQNSGTSNPYCSTKSASSNSPNWGQFSRITWNGTDFGVVGGKENHPMTVVSWYGAAAYANWRSGMEGLTPSYDTNTWACNFAANGYRLPTEAEWEKAARGGNHSPYYRYPWGDSLVGSNANYAGSSDPFDGTNPNPQTTPVGFYNGNQIPPGVDMANGYGLYDMAGNVWEWVNDWYAPDYYTSTSPFTSNPQGPTTMGLGRVFRGGAYDRPASLPTDLRCAKRNYDPPGFFHYVFGFRLALKSSVQGGTAFSISLPAFLNTQSPAAATLTGRVLAVGNTPIAGASVVLQPSSFSAMSAPDGQFVLSGAPAGQGYKLRVIAAGYVPQTQDNFAVNGGAQPLGDITLTPISGNYTLRSLVPDINPGVVSTVEESGVAYRYYVLRDAVTDLPVGGVPVTVRPYGGGTTVPQTESDTSRSYAGQLVGVSDAGTGIVRLMVPASAVGTAGTMKQFQTEVLGAIGPTFMVSVLPRQYEFFWAQESQGGVHGRINLFKGARVGAEKGYRTEVRREFGNSSNYEELVRQTTNRLEAGVEVGLPIGGAANVTGVEASAGVGLYAELERALGYEFDRNSTDPQSAALRLYCFYFDLFEIPLMSAPIAFVRAHVEPLFLIDVYRWSKLGFEFGPYARVEGSLSAKVGKEFAVGGYLNLDEEVGARVQTTYDVVLQEKESAIGLAADLSVVAGIVAGFRPYAGTGRPAGVKSVMDNLKAQFGPAAEFTLVAEQLVATVTEDGAAYPREVRIKTSLGGVSQILNYDVWNQSGLGSLPNETLRILHVDFAQPISSGTEWNRMKGLSTRLRLLFDGSAPASLNTAFGSETLQAAFPVSPYQQDMTYELSIDAVDQDRILDLGGGGHVIVGGGFSVKFDWEKGRTVALKSGKLRGGQVFPLHHTAGLYSIPANNQTIGDLQTEWFDEATSVFQQVLNTVENTVQDLSQTVVTAFTNTGQALLTIGLGALQVGSNVFSESWNGEPDQRPRPAGQRHTEAAQLDATISLLYGVGGMYHFTADSDPTQPVTLAISYMDDRLFGVNEMSLRIYRRDDDNEKWELIGGTVDPIANTVTAGVTKLGVFALAPALPTGSMVFQLSLSLVPADGLSTVTATTTGLAMNDGTVAADGWMYTVSALDMQILSADEDPARAGVQVSCMSASLVLTFRAPTSGGVGQFAVASVFGDATGEGLIAFEDLVAPPAPTGLSTFAGQSRVLVWWDTAGMPADVEGYRVYYRVGQAGPPWDGTSMVDGQPSPVSATTDMVLLRGLTPGATYHTAVSALDKTGNEGPLSAAVTATTGPAPPAPPTNVLSEPDGPTKQILSWTISEDDGFNDRDVDHYEVYRGMVDGAGLVKVEEVAAGQALYTDADPAVAGLNGVIYVVYAVDSGGLNSNVDGQLALGDVDQNGFVDATDYTLLQPCLTGPEAAPTGGMNCLMADVDGDGDVDVLDFALLQSCYHGDAGLADPTCGR